MTVTIRELECLASHWAQVSKISRFGMSEQPELEAESGHEDCVSASDGQLVGGLILRGNHCVLIRSLTGEWDGMRLPWAAADQDERTADAALRIVSELCEIEASEVRVLEELAPVTVAVPGMPIFLHALYAVDPPPAGFVADVEDPEDGYDWQLGTDH